MRPTLANPFYYLDNFQQVLDWVGLHHGDLLDATERAFLDRFQALPQAARALLVRLVMRKGVHFRASKLRYAEIGCPLAAAAPLVAEGWIDPAPALDLDALCRLLTRAELLAAFALPASLRKGELRDQLQPRAGEPRPLADWCPALAEQVFELKLEALCQRLRLLFFGNLRQDWSEFVLADLGIYRYEQVAFSPASRAFSSRAELDAYLALHQCRERLEAGEPAAALLSAIPAEPFASPWLESRRGKLLLKVGLQLERDGELALAAQVHAGNRYPGARARQIRVLERLGRTAEALVLGETAQAGPESESEAQQLERMLPRLRRAAGLPRLPRTAPAPLDELQLVLPRPPQGGRVEWAVAEHLAGTDAPVHYVENTLITGLFGLLCWEALFAPLPGAFCHPYHAAPADLARADFVSRRAALFAACLARLDDGSYAERIRQTWAEKHGLLSPFVVWPALDEALLERALACLPAAHLKRLFQRLLADLPNNRAGLPDLIQFWPAEGRYRLIEVKGPGDRLQDNQIRWLDYAVRHGLPVSVCYVRWAEP